MEKHTLGVIISSLRKEHGMTQLELASKMNVTDKAVSKWERDLSCPDINSLPKLAEIFHISVDELMQVSEPHKNTEVKAKITAIMELVFKAIALAMGVAVVVLSSFGDLDPSTAITLLGIGLSCAGISLLQKKES